jgi:hypothetical protein
MFTKRFFPLRFFPKRFYPTRPVSGGGGGGIGKYFSTRFFAPRWFSKGWFHSFTLSYPTQASYTEVFDFGLVIGGALVNVSWNSQQLDQSNIASVSCQIEPSADGVTFGAAVSGTVAYFSDCRYARVTLTIVASNDKAIVTISNLYCSVDIKYAVDSGDVLADSTDVSGTPVLFNKAFKDVNSITLTVFSVEPITAVYDFSDVPNPTGFLVYAFDNTGARVTYPVSWKARGII